MDRTETSGRQNSNRQWEHKKRRVSMRKQETEAIRHNNINKDTTMINKTEEAHTWNISKHNTHTGKKHKKITHRSNNHNAT